MKYILALIPCLLTSCAIVFSQSNVDEALSNYYSQYLKGESTMVISNSLVKMNSDAVFNRLERNTLDTSERKRYATFKLIDFIGIKSADASVRKRAVKQLVLGCKDKDGGIVGTVLKDLTFYNIADFEPESKYLLSEMSKKPMPHYELVIKICGWLNITDLIYNFRQMITDKKGNVMQRWAMRLAMARMGEQDMLDYCMQRIRNIPVNDNMAYDLVPDMVYTRQRPMFDYLFKIIESDDKNCSSPNPDSNAKILCGYRVIEQIAPYIKYFPVEVGVSGDLKVKNYEKALIDVRNWIKQNKDTYVIKNEEF